MRAEHAWAQAYLSIAAKEEGGLEKGPWARKVAKAAWEQNDEEKRVRGDGDSGP